MANAVGAAVNYALSTQELEQFQRDGFIGPFDVYEPAEMEQALQAMRPKLIDSRQGVYHQGDALSGTTNLASYDRHLDVDFLARHVSRPEIVDRVTSALGPDALCWRTEFFPKYPGDEGTDWHQADNFANVGKHPQIVWPEDAGFGGALTVWTAFTDSVIENGCLQFIPGSHKTMNYDENKVIEYDADRINQSVKNGVRRGFYGYDYRQLQKDPNWSPDESKAKSMVMRQGQAIMFWSTLMHASHPHSGVTDKMRLGFTARYVPTAVQVYPHQDTLAEYGVEVSLEKWGCVLVSGKDDYGHNRFVDRTINGTPFELR
ncbi:chlorinating enzyme [Streptomyces sp. NPDC007095]|jgi:non-heme Fe2+,alpha-ketoglutarate-dependent halogenase|uniref:chlorinating enzyme n=1 Tax=Streptomyces sp. NPDC007095 TaxID=3154482 RepID=UPI000C707A8A